MSPVADAIDELFVAVRQGRADLFAARPDLDPIDVADGELFLGQLLDGAMQFVQADPTRPAFVPWTTPSRRWMDNGADSAYWMAPVDGAHRYRVHGRRGDECYLSLTLYAGDPGHPERVAFAANDRELDLAADGTFSIDLEPPADACYVIVRHYYRTPESDRAGTFGIDVIDGAVGEVPDEAAIAHRWRAATSFIHAMTRVRPPAARMPAYVSQVPNVMGDPSVWSAAEGGGRGTVDQTYASGPFALEAHEALVMRVRFPHAVYASAALWNRFSQSIDHRFHPSTVNAAHAVPDADGSVRVVVAHRDPGVPNWLDTGGRRRGSVFWRFLLAEEAPSPIECSVVPVDSLRP
jgi:hypothetical protein